MVNQVLIREEGICTERNPRFALGRGSILLSRHKKPLLDQCPFIGIIQRSIVAGQMILQRLEEFVRHHRPFHILINFAALSGSAIMRGMMTSTFAPSA